MAIAAASWMPTQIPEIEEIERKWRSTRRASPLVAEESSFAITTGTSELTFRSLKPSFHPNPTIATRAALH